MNWFYALAGEQKGPVSQEELDRLHQTKVVLSSTLVWREGMGDWQPYYTVNPTSLRLESFPEPPPAATTRGLAGTGQPPVAGVPPAGSVVCHECQKPVAPDQAIRHGDFYICAACKPVFVQKLKEGVDFARGLALATLGSRFGARFLDGILVAILWFGAILVPTFILGAVRPALLSAGPGIGMVGVFAIILVVPLVYETFFIGKFGATLGKMAAKVKVVRASGARVGYGRAFVRALLNFIFMQFGGLLHLVAVFDDQKRTIPDRVCDTRVILTKK
jgi:uncharacterized RDD family membrane protein YckC